MSLGNLGNILMLTCLLASLIQALYLIYPHTSFGKININYRVLTRIIFITCLASFLLLIYLFLESNFNYQLVVNNSHSEKPLFIRLLGRGETMKAAYYYGYWF